MLSSSAESITQHRPIDVLPHADWLNRLSQQVGLVQIAYHALFKVRNGEATR